MRFLFLEKNVSPGSSPVVGSGHSVLDRVGIWVRSHMESQEDSEDRVSGNDITPPPFTLLFYRHGALGIYLYVFVAHFTEFLLGSQGIPFQQMGKMCLLSLLDGQPASSQGLLGRKGGSSFSSWASFRVPGSHRRQL